MKKLISNLKRIRKIDKYTFVYANSMNLYKVILEISQCEDLDSIDFLRKNLLHELYFSYLFIEKIKNKELASEFEVIKKLGIEINYFLEEYCKNPNLKCNLEKAKMISEQFCVKYSKSFKEWEAYITEYFKISKIRMTVLLIMLAIILSSSPFVIKFISDAFDMSEIEKEELEDNYFFLDIDMALDEDFCEYLEEDNVNRKLIKCYKNEN